MSKHPDKSYFTRLGQSLDQDQKMHAARAGLCLLFGSVWVDHRDLQVGSAADSLFEMAGEDAVLKASQELDIMNINPDGDKSLVQRAKGELQAIRGVFQAKLWRYFRDARYIAGRNL